MTDTEATPARLSELLSAIHQASGAAISGQPVDQVLQAYRSALACGTAICRESGQIGREPMAALVSSGLEALEADARDFLSETSLAPERVVAGLALLKGYGSLMRRITRRAEHAAIQEETPFLLIELEEVENGLRALGSAADGQPPLLEAARDQLADLRRRVLWDHAQRQLEASLDDPARTTPEAEDGFLRFRELDRTRRQLRVLAAPRDSGVAREQLGGLDQLESECARLEQSCFQCFEQIGAPAGLRVLTDLGLQLCAELDEARMTSYEVDTVEELDELQRLHRLALAFGEAWDRALTRVRQTGAEHFALEGGLRARRRLRRMSNGMRNLVADRVLSIRLDRLFGRRLVQVWEAIVFWLIVAVLGLILVDHYSDPPQADRIAWTTWADTGICAVLLLDFLTRLLLTPRRLSHFRRHFLTELLPSIPFGLLVSLEYVGALRTVRALRLVRVFRVLRILRPLIRMARLSLFVSRAVDRLVEKNAWLLNQNIIFFTDPVKDERVPTLLKRARDLDAWISRSARECLPEMTGSAQLEWAVWRARLIEADLAHLDRRPSRITSTTARLGDGGVRDLDVDDVVRTLRDLNGHRIAEFMGLEFARQVSASLRFFRLPLIRKLPVVSYVLGPTGPSDPLSTTARLGRVLGDLLAFAHRTLTWFADLYGSITGAQFLDRIGMQLVKATARPARRLVLFSVIVGLVLLVVRMTRLEFLEVAANVMLKFLTLPVLILGGVCCVPLVLGLWFRRIAGQAADFYDRVAEAQFLPLTETLKSGQSEAVLRTLAERVVLPEARLCEAWRAKAEDLKERQLLDRFVSQGLIDPLMSRRLEAIDTQTSPGSGHWETLLLFFLTFQDGAYFHRNDTAVANMLLGNLTLENIRASRLRYSKRERKRLLSLDIGRGKGGVTGPYVWFNFITHSVSQHTARLVIEYNQHCIPCDELDVADSLDRELFECWLAERLALSSEREQGTVSRGESKSRVSGADGTLVYRTTEFNALHFLTRESGRDDSIRIRFGESVLALMREDRENLIRVIFGTYPMGELPKEKRTFNPYAFYRRYFSRGKVFLFPLIGAWFVLRSIRLLISRLLAIIKDVIDPDSRPLKVATGRAGFDVARRKIHRMRRPVVLEAVRLRAEFDVQYLGLELPGGKPGGWAGEQLADDLRALNASEREWEEFRELKSLRQKQLRQLASVLHRAHSMGEEILSEAVRRNPSLKGREQEALRAMSAAYVCDHAHVFQIIEAYESLRELLASAAHQPPTRRRLRGLGDRRLAALVERAEDLMRGCNPEPVSRDTVLACVLQRGPEAQGWLESLLQNLPVGVDPYRFVHDRLLQVAEQPFSWSEQIVAIRAVQTLGMLDLSGYEQLIRALGDYGPEDVVT